MDKELIDRAWACLPREFKEEVKEDYNYALLNKEYTKQQILENLFGEHNLTSDAEGEEMLTVSRKKVQEMFGEAQKAIPTCEHDRGFRNAELTILRILFGYKCLPDTSSVASNVASPSQNPPENCNSGPHISTGCDKPAEPKFKVGDKVRILSLHGSPTPDNGVVDVIAHINKGNRKQMYYLENHYHCAFGFSESDLEPYTEPTEKIGNPDFSNASKSVRLESDSAAHVGTSNETVDRDHNRLRIAAMAMQGILSNPSPQMVDMPIDRVAQLADAMASILIAECEKGGQS